MEAREIILQVSFGVFPADIVIVRIVREDGVEVAQSRL
jgi:hypothetical protein